MPRKFNFIFEQLVKDENDVHGLISYGVYKTKKINFIREYKEKNGEDPS